MVTDLLKINFGDYFFNISTMSFYQVNPIQTEKMYNLAISQADIQENDTVLDLYCGIGTIGIFASAKAKKVYGMEIVEQAIENAKDNAKLNNIQNIEFFAQDVGKSLEKLMNKKPDIILVDPPRKGLDNMTVCNLIDFKPKKIVYISCNPATLMRDLSKLEEIYDIKKITPIDLFPFTRTCRNNYNIDKKRLGNLIYKNSTI